MTGDLDVSSLPVGSFGPRSALWWGQVGMMTIESTMLCIIIGAYFYVQPGFSVWPPPSDALPELLLPTVGLVLLLLSCVPMVFAGKAVKRGEFGKTLFYMALNVTMAFMFLIIRTIEFNHFNFKWSTDIYGSFIWILLGIHTMHVIADTIESTVFLFIFGSDRIGAKQQLGVEVDGLYWYWVTAIWVPLYFLIYVYPNLLKG